jgi:hypothetical protein
MLINDYTVRRIEKHHIGPLFKLAKQCLHEKGIEKIKDDLLMAGLKNAVSKKLQIFDFGIFKLNTLIGFAFVEVKHIFYLDKPTATLESIYLLPEHRTEENYMQLLDYIIDLLTSLEIKNIITTDNWTLCNDCEILKGALGHLNHREEKIYNLEK